MVLQLPENPLSNQNADPLFPFTFYFLPYKGSTRLQVMLLHSAASAANSGEANLPSSTQASVAI